MALNLMDLPVSSNGGWFKPEAHKDAVAILIEVRDWQAQVPGNYGPKDTAFCDITIFDTQSELDEGKPSSVNENTRVEATVLARDLKPLVGGACVVTLDQVPVKKAGANPAWVWVKASGAVVEKVVAYANARDAAVEAALADAPDFD